MLKTLWKGVARIAQLDRIFAWSFLGVILAIFGLWYTRDNPARLSFEILSRVKVYDVHADVPNLAILFNNENINEKKQGLSIFTVRISNIGGRDVIQNMYADSQPFGLRVQPGRVFPPELVDASQSYLTTSVQPRLNGQNAVELQKVVIDSGANFTLRFLVLHPQDKDPEVITASAHSWVA